MFRSKSNHAEIVAPEQDPAVISAQQILERIAAELAVAEGELREAEVELSMAEDHAAESIIADGPPVSLARDREAVALRRDSLRILHKAHEVATQRHAAALESARRTYQAVLWTRYQDALRVMIERGDNFALAQDEVMRYWNLCGQPGQVPRFQGNIQTWRSDFRQHLESLVNSPEIPPSMAVPHAGPKPY